MKWADEIVDKLERRIGIDMPFGSSYTLDIVIHKNDGPGPDKVATIERTAGGKLSQRLLIYDYETVDIKSIQNALCRLLLNTYIWSENRTRPTPNIKRQTTIRPIPRWLSLGVSQNLFPSQRSQNSRLVLADWLHGKLMPLPEFLQSEVSLPVNTSPITHHPSPITRRIDKAMSGMLVAWISSLPDNAECFKNIFALLAAGRNISSEALAACIPGYSSIADLEDGWDNWILRQKRMVYDPGAVSSRVINQLKAELLLYPGDFGIPLTINRYPGIQLRDLIEKRKSPWIPAFSSGKSTSLRLLATGRGKELGEVVESYCRFLEALAKRKSKRYLKKLLNKAENELEELSMQVKDRDSGINF